MIPETDNPQRRKVSIRVSLRGMLRLIRVDTLRCVHNVSCFRETAHMCYHVCFVCVYGAL